MNGKPVTIRLLELTINDIFPTTSPDDVTAIANKLHIPPEKCVSRIEAMKEVHSKMGVRGCRLSILQPKILEMQIRAILRK
jgi:phosphoenolpyruvate-protein kinase (PTS system EI component)